MEAPKFGRTPPVAQGASALLTWAQTWIMTKVAQDTVRVVPLDTVTVQVDEGLGSTPFRLTDIPVR